MKSYNILLVLSIILLAYGCKKEETDFSYLQDFKYPGEDVPRFKMDEDFVRYFATPKEGSLFIFEDSWDGSYDTVSVSATEFFSWENDDQYVDQEFSLHYDCQQMKDFRLRTEMFWQAEDSSWLYQTEYQRTTYAPVTFQKRSGEYFSYYGHEFVDSMEVGGQTYYDVLLLDFDDNVYDSYLVFAKDIGLIKIGGRNTSNHTSLIYYELK